MDGFATNAESLCFQVVNAITENGSAGLAGSSLTLFIIFSMTDASIVDQMKFFIANQKRAQNEL